MILMNFSTGLHRRKTIVDKRLSFFSINPVFFHPSLNIARVIYDFPSFLINSWKNDVRKTICAKELENMTNYYCISLACTTMKHVVLTSRFFFAGTRESRGKGQWERSGFGLGEGWDGRRTRTLAGVTATSSRIDTWPGSNYESQLESYTEENGQGKDIHFW